MTRVIDLDHENLQSEGAPDLTESDDKVTPLVQTCSPKRMKQPLLGSHSGWVTYIADDFVAELPDSFWLGKE